MNEHLHHGFVSVPAPATFSGALTDFLNRGGRITYTVPGWFCEDCRGATGLSAGVMVATRDHAKCGVPARDRLIKALAAFGEEKP